MASFKHNFSSIFWWNLVTNTLASIWIYFVLNFTGNGLLIYAGGNAANLALAFSGSESQAAENDQKSGYNTQNMGLQSGIEATEYEDDQKNEWLVISKKYV